MNAASSRTGVSLELVGATPDVPTFRPYFDGAIGNCDLRMETLAEM